MSWRAFLAGLGAALSAAAAAGPPPRAPQDPDAFVAEVLPLLDRYCSFCHEGAEAEAELDLMRFERGAEAAGAPEVWQRVHLQLGGGLMPPAKSKEQPNEHERATILRWIESVVDPRTAAGPAVPHAPILRRLTRFEYHNTVRDLTGVDFPAEDFFPSDGVALGFDNLGSALSTSGALVEKFLEAAERIAEQAIVVEDLEHPPTRQFLGSELGEHVADGSQGLYTRSAAAARLTLPRAGAYRVRVQAWGQQAGPEPCRMQVRLGEQAFAAVEVPAVRGQPQVFEFEASAPGGRLRVAAEFLNDYYQPQDPDPAQRDRNLYVDWIEVVGPLDPAPLPSFQSSLFARFRADLGARRERAMTAWLARRAWRRPATPEELERLDALSPAGEPLAAAMRTTLTALLASPHFLFRIEGNPPRGGGSDPDVRDLDAHELATRLSYFLWSSMPDEELAALADDGRLLRPEVLQLQAERMLKHARSRALATSFAAQWLQVRNLERVAPDPDLFPDFTPSLRAAMREETLRLFEFVMREERSAWELLDADYSFLNAELAAHYGIAGVEGAELRKTSLLGTPRRGLLGQGSVLTVTSTPVRTAPVKRGKFILENVLGKPLPPPPPGVGSLPEEAEAGRAASLRERLARHRADPACGVCHAVMDPLGFALENYDPVGRWRTSEAGFPIDAAGALPDGRSFAGPEELVRTLRADGGFVRCLTEKLMIYALGRAPQVGDAAALDAILAGVASPEPTIPALVLAIIESPLFRQRTITRR